MKERANPLSELIVASLCAYGAWFTRDWINGEWMIMPYLLAFFAAWIFFWLTLNLVFFIIPQIWRYSRLMKPKGRVGSASWSSTKEMDKNKHFKRNGFFVGAKNKRAVFVDIESSGLVL